jgi:hypothetical protein
VFTAKSELFHERVNDVLRCFLVLITHTSDDTEDSYQRTEEGQQLT